MSERTRCARCHADSLIDFVELTSHSGGPLVCVEDYECFDRVERQRDAWRHYALAWKNCASPEVLHRAEGRVRTLCGEDALP